MYKHSTCPMIGRFFIYIYVQLCTFRSMCWQKTLIVIIVLALNIIYSDQSTEGNKNTLKKWFNQVKLPSFTCPHTQNNEKFSSSMQNDTTPLVQVVDCNEPGAIYQYDYKVPGGKKPKKGKFNGYGTLTFSHFGGNAKLYGVRNGKCLKISERELRSISGYFEQDVLMGEVSMTFQDQLFAKGFIDNGVLVGLVRYFTAEGQLKNITNISTNKVYLSIHETAEKEFKYYVMNVVENYIDKETGYERKLLTNMEEFYDCIQIDGNFFVKCFKINADNIIETDGFKIEFINRSSGSTTDKTFNLLLDPWKEMSTDENAEKPSCMVNSNSTIRTTLEHWTYAVADRKLFWNHFATEIDAINPKDPRIDIMIHYLKDQPGFKHTRATIETSDGSKLFRGVLINGHLTGHVDQNMVNHPGWKTRLNIQIEKNAIMKIGGDDAYSGMGGIFIGSTKTTEISMRVTLKNGKLDGLVQIYGVLPRNHVGHCSDIITAGLGFVGYFENGFPVGPVWRQLVGGSWLYGVLDENYEFTGKDIAFIHQDMELAMIGQFDKGLMVNGQEAEVIEERCNEYGMKVLKFSQPSGPIYHYSAATNSTFGDQPLLRDPLAKKYLYLKNSNDLIADESAEEAEGTFATRDVPANTVFVQYGGMLYDKIQTDIRRANVERIRSENNWIHDDPKSAHLWMYAHNLRQCGITIDIPPAYKSTSDYQGTLGHKVNHRFNPNSVYVHYDTPRFGIILAVMTQEKIVKDQEYFADYGYTFNFAPRWHRMLFRQFAKENPTQNNLLKLDNLNEEEKNAANNLADTSGMM